MHVASNFSVSVEDFKLPLQGLPGVLGEGLSLHAPLLPTDQIHVLIGSHGTVGRYRRADFHTYIPYMRV